MEVLYFKPDEYLLRYNCSFYNYDSIPQKSLKHEFLGVLVFISYLTFFVNSLLFNLVCNAQHSASETVQVTGLMILLGFIHVVGLQFSGLATAWLAIEGAVFCHHPKIIYWCGSLGLATWCGSTLTSMILGFNRCCELYGSFAAQKLFGGRRLWIWISLPCIYMLVYAFLHMPSFVQRSPNGLGTSGFFNPHSAFFDDSEGIYHNHMHTLNNFIVCTSESLLYSTLIILYWRATSIDLNRNEKQFQTRKEGNPLKDCLKIYIQVILIGFIHFTASFCYVLMQYIPVNFYTTLTSSTFYLLSQGFPPVIYLLVNQTLRNVILRKLGLRKQQRTSTINSNIHSNGQSRNNGQPMTMTHNLDRF
ncbi:Serpentine Receptor, class T [Aphelenchoides bicaudatus]|nr:Serpentine Receptor, class T [Aphelenchoides bicaudatus]